MKVKGGYSIVCPKCGRRVKPEVRPGVWRVEDENGGSLEIPGLIHTCPNCGSVVNFRAGEGSAASSIGNVSCGSRGCKSIYGAEGASKVPEEKAKTGRPHSRGRPTEILPRIINALRGVCTPRPYIDRYGHRGLLLKGKIAGVKLFIRLFESFRRSKHTPATINSILRALDNFEKRYFPKSLAAFYNPLEGHETTTFIIINKCTRKVKQMIRELKPRVHIVERTWLTRKRQDIVDYIKNVIYNFILKRLMRLKEALEAKKIRQPWGPVKDLLEELQLLVRALGPPPEIIY